LDLDLKVETLSECSIPIRPSTSRQAEKHVDKHKSHHHSHKSDRHKKKEEKVEESVKEVVKERSSVFEMSQEDVRREARKIAIGRGAGLREGKIYFVTDF
jgi:CRISPR/Cas system CSM-associated protein Csm5 (group 7 of RAMP superfamily)